MLASVTSQREMLALPSQIHYNIAGVCSRNEAAIIFGGSCQDTVSATTQTLPCLCQIEPRIPNKT